MIEYFFDSVVVVWLQSRWCRPAKSSLTNKPNMVSRALTEFKLRSTGLSIDRLAFIDRQSLVYVDWTQRHCKREGRRVISRDKEQGCITHSASSVPEGDATSEAWRSSWSWITGTANTNLSVQAGCYIHRVQDQDEEMKLPHQVLTRPIRSLGRKEWWVY